MSYCRDCGSKPHSAIEAHMARSGESWTCDECFILDQHRKTADLDREAVLWAALMSTPTFVAVAQ